VLEWAAHPRALYTSHTACPRPSESIGRRASYAQLPSTDQRFRLRGTGCSRTALDKPPRQGARVGNIANRDGRRPSSRVDSSNPFRGLYWSRSFRHFVLDLGRLVGRSHRGLTVHPYGVCPFRRVTPKMITRRAPNKIGRASRRSASPLNAGRQLGRALHAQSLVSAAVAHIGR